MAHWAVAVADRVSAPHISEYGDSRTSRRSCDECHGDVEKMFDTESVPIRRAQER